MIWLSKAYCFFAGFHRKLYSSGFLKAVRINKPVIAIGNLTFGGTGKTPFVQSLVEDLKELGLKPAIVVRSYKATTKISALIDLEKSKQPQIWGDEACWYFEKAQVPVYSGPEKWRSALLAAENKQVNVVVVDDGFQHHKLFKDFNIILIDALAGLKSLKNKARENLSALKEAHAIVLTRSNLISSEVLQNLKAYVPSGKPVFLNSVLAQPVRDFSGGLVSLLEKKVGLVSGIANPLSFLAAYKKMNPEVQVKLLQFSDHHEYRIEDLEKIENFKKENRLNFVIITEKDEVKIRPLILKHEPLKADSFGVMPIETQMQDKPQWRSYLNGLIS